jgi:hypothetical protein
MTLMTRIRAMVSSLGNEGALTNVMAEMGRAAAQRHAVDQLELRVAIATNAPSRRVA